MTDYLFSLLLHCMFYFMTPTTAIRLLTTLIFMLESILRTLVFFFIAKRVYPFFGGGGGCPQTPVVTAS